MDTSNRTLEWALAAAAVAAGAAALTGAWALALRARGLPWTVDALVEVHRLEPLLFYAAFLPVLAVTVSIAYARAILQVQSLQEQVDRGPEGTPALRSVRSALPRVPDGLIAIDEADRVVDMNPAAELMFGCGCTEAVGVPLSRLVQEHPGAAPASARRTTRGEVVGASWRASARHRDGSAFEVEVSAVDRTGGQPRCLVVRDVVEARPEQSRDPVQLIAAVSREIRSPVNLVSASAEMALHEARRAGNVSLCSDLERISYGCRRLLYLADDLLDLSRLRTGTIPTHTERADVLALCGAVLHELRTTEGKDRVELDVRTAVPAVRTDPEKLSRILLRLLQASVRSAFQDRLRLLVWSARDALHIEARGGSGERPGEGQDLEALVVRGLVDVLGATLQPANDDRMWRLSLPIDAGWACTPGPREDMTVPLADFRSVSGPGSYEITSTDDDYEAYSRAPVAVPATPAPSFARTAEPSEASHPARPAAPSFRSSRRGLLPRRSSTSFASIPPVAIRVAVFDADPSSRRLLIEALSARGLEPTEHGLGKSLRSSRSRALVVRLGPEPVGLDALLQEARRDQIPVHLIAVDAESSAGCRLRVDSVHLEEEEARSIPALASGLQPKGEALVLHGSPDARERVASPLHRAGWSVVLTTNARAAGRRIRANAPGLLVVDASVPDVADLLATLARGSDVIGHVALRVKAGVDRAPDWLRRLPQAVPLSTLGLELAAELASSTQSGA